MYDLNRKHPVLSPLIITALKDLANILDVNVILYIQLFFRKEAILVICLYTLFWYLLKQCLFIYTFQGCVYKSLKNSFLIFHDMDNLAKLLIFLSIIFF